MATKFDPQTTRGHTPPPTATDGTQKRNELGPSSGQPSPRAGQSTIPEAHVAEPKTKSCKDCCSWVNVDKAALMAIGFGAAAKPFVGFVGSGNDILNATDELPVQHNHTSNNTITGSILATDSDSPQWTTASPWLPTSQQEQDEWDALPIYDTTTSKATKEAYRVLVAEVLPDPEDTGAHPAIAKTATTPTIAQQLTTVREIINANNHTGTEYADVAPDELYQGLIYAGALILTIPNIAF